MNINLNDYHDSYANAIGNRLKTPLNYLVCKTAALGWNVESQNRIGFVAKVALQCLLVPTCIIPFSISWVAGKTFIYFSNTQINHQNLSKVPPLIDIPFLDENDQKIDIYDLSTKFDTIYKNKNDETQKSLKHYLNLMCRKVVTKYQDDNFSDATQLNLFYGQLSVYLKLLVKKINSNVFTQEKVKAILDELAEASRVCFPTWLETAAKLYTQTHKDENTVEAKLLRHIQNYKEDITREFTQQEIGTHWNTLNTVRNVLGIELGLSMTSNQIDPFASQTIPFIVKYTIKWLFLQKYENVDHLITSIQTRINLQPYDDSYYSYLLGLIKEFDIQDKQDYILENFYEEGKLNKVAINFMLKSIEIIK